MSEIDKELEILEKEKVANAANTEMVKYKFGLELKNGLGEEIKKNPNSARFIKRSKIEKLKVLLKKIVNKF